MECIFLEGDKESLGYCLEFCWNYSCYWAKDLAGILASELAAKQTLRALSGRRCANRARQANQRTFSVPFWRRILVAQFHFLALWFTVCGRNKKAAASLCVWAHPPRHNERYAYERVFNLSSFLFETNFLKIFKMKYEQHYQRWFS